MNDAYTPEKCVWELTLKCNLQCTHCGSIAGNARKNELSVDECLNIADQLLDLGCKRVTLIGGEITLYKGWEKIARKLSEGGAVVNIITNAYILGDEQIDQIEYARLNNVGISVDGMEENHNKIRNSKKSFGRVLQAFELLRRSEISIAVVTCILNSNVADLEPMYDLLVENRISVWQLQIATPMGNMAKLNELLLNPSKLSIITDFIKNRRKEHRIAIYAADNIGYYDENEPYLRSLPGAISAWNGCQAGLKIVGIDSVGNVKGCISLYSNDFIEGNLREEPLEDIWSKEGNFAYNRQFDVSMLTGDCRRCDKGQICHGGCRAMCYFKTGLLFENNYCDYPGRYKKILI